MMASEMIVIFHHDERGAVRTWSEIGKLVRCKDCTEYQEKFRWCKLHDGEMQLEDYCSYGERKPDGRLN